MAPEPPAAPALGVRERRKRQTRAALLAAAEDLFAERGFEHVTVAEIAAAAGVSVKTLFQYFRAKEELVFGNETGLIDRLLAAIRERAPDETPLQAITASLIADVDDQTNPNGLERYHRMTEGSPAIQSRLRRMWADYEMILARALADEANQARPTAETRLVAAQLITMVRVITSPEVREFVTRHSAHEQRKALKQWITDAADTTGKGLDNYDPRTR